MWLLAADTLPFSPINIIQISRKCSDLVQVFNSRTAKHTNLNIPTILFKCGFDAVQYHFLYPSLLCKYPSVRAINAIHEYLSGTFILTNGKILTCLFFKSHIYTKTSHLCVLYLFHSVTHSLNTTQCICGRSIMRDGMLNMQGLILDLPRQMLGHYTPTSGGPLLSEVYEVTLSCDLCNPS